MRILISGVSGFIGSHLAELFLSQGNTVVGLDNGITGQQKNLSYFQKYPSFKFIEHDVINAFAIEGTLDWVMHFASPASPPKYLHYPIETLRVNSEGTYHLLELAKTKGARFFLASTSEVYGDPNVHPQRESYWGNVNPIGPRSVYDEAKRYAEAITTAYSRNFNLSIRIIRIFNTYGPRMDAKDGRVVTNLINQAIRNLPLTIYGNGKQTRSFQYVSDLIDGIARLMKIEYYEPVNLGNPEEYDMLELAEKIIEITSSSSLIEFLPLPQDDPRQRKPDISIAKRILNWEPTVMLNDGLLETIAFYKAPGV